MTERLMRLRSSPHLRDLCDEIGFTRSHLIQPLFVVDGLREAVPISGMRGNTRMDMDSCLRQMEADLDAGVRHFILFPVPAEKRASHFDHRFSQRVIAGIRTRFGSAPFIWVDTCLCSYTDHGHCCVFTEQGETNLDATLDELAGAALAFAQAGADGVSPSDMMDGRVARIRSALDEGRFETLPIMSYSTKFASSFYGPFREAADSAPRFGDRKAYQIDVRNRSDALRASRRCAEEGADLLMVKPGMTSIDLIQPIRDLTLKPVGVYQVSGEYAALSLLAERGLADFERALLETWHVFRRAGSQFIITYGARYARAMGL